MPVDFLGADFCSRAGRGTEMDYGQRFFDGAEDPFFQLVLRFQRKSLHCPAIVMRIWRCYDQRNRTRMAGLADNEIKQNGGSQKQAARSLARAVPHQLGEVTVADDCKQNHGVWAIERGSSPHAASNEGRNCAEKIACMTVLKLSVVRPRSSASWVAISRQWVERIAMSSGGKGYPPENAEAQPHREGGVAGPLISLFGQMVDSDDDEEPGVLIQVCGDPDCSMEGDLPMIQCMGPGCSSQYHRCCTGIQESETEDAVEEWFCNEDYRVNAGCCLLHCGKCVGAREEDKTGGGADQSGITRLGAYVHQEESTAPEVIGKGYIVVITWVQ
ncbi:hypothetical protein B0H10DRAFT_1949405 [Mycena sp. CBHHK59/15]|nr:hypothetical protein B0H10DRAFT_1949405 [Mycena sp. CBHHK59/15]